MHDRVMIFVQIDDEVQGAPAEFGLADLPEGFTADDVVALMKRDGAKHQVLSDWNLLDDPAIHVQVSRPADKPGRWDNTHARW